MLHNNKAILLISSPDKEGLVYKVTEFIFIHKGNLLHAEQHIDKETNYFFMRLEFEIANSELDKATLLAQLEPIKQQYNMNIQLFFREEPQKVAIFTSKTDHCLYDLLIKNKSEELQFNPCCIISNHQNTQSIAEHFHIPFHHIPVIHEYKKEAEVTQLKILAEYKVDLIVLARYMQVLGPDFVSQYNRQIINVHHSFLPAFVGADPDKQAYNRGVKIIGATSHYTTNILDEGPIIEQKVVRVNHKDNLEGFIRKGKELEKQVLSYAVNKHLQNKILVFENKTVVFD